MYDDINYVCAKKDGKYGVIDTDGKIIIPFEHDASVYSFDQGCKVGQLGYTKIFKNYREIN